MFFDIARIARQSQKSPTEDSKLEDRLRARAKDWYHNYVDFAFSDSELMVEAADALASFWKRVEELTARLVVLELQRNQESSRALAAEAEVKELKQENQRLYHALVYE